MAIFNWKVTENCCCNRIIPNAEHDSNISWELCGFYFARVKRNQDNLTDSPTNTRPTHWGGSHVYYINMAYGLM